VPDLEGDQDLEVLLDYLRRSRGFDFTGYKRTSLTRRIDKRMQVVGADSYLGYLDHLEVDPEEFTHLFNTILINVTCFFRDPPTWEFLSAEILPQLLADKPADEPIRIWSAGCASGEEAYSLVMVTAEALGPEAVRERVKIYATDVDEEALNQARQARYTARQVEGVPRSCWPATSRETARVTSSRRSCGARSSSAATTSSRTPPSPGSTCWSAATP
jgi:two-component system, chemotaxis family, CheB/CheR fusion protein